MVRRRKRGRWRPRHRVAVQHAVTRLGSRLAGVGRAVPVSVRRSCATPGFVAGGNSQVETAPNRISPPASSRTLPKQVQRPLVQGQWSIGARRCGSGAPPGYARSPLSQRSGRRILRSRMAAMIPTGTARRGGLRRCDGAFSQLRARGRGPRLAPGRHGSPRGSATAASSSDCRRAAAPATGPAGLPRAGGVVRTRPGRLGARRRTSVRADGAGR